MKYYFNDPWNAFDFCVVVGYNVALLLYLVGSSAGGFKASAVRPLRLLLGLHLQRAQYVLCLHAAGLDSLPLTEWSARKSEMSNFRENRASRMMQSILQGSMGRTKLRAHQNNSPRSMGKDA